MLRQAKSNGTKPGNGEGDAPRQLRYEQAKLAVQEYIRTHNLKPGDRLPTEEELRRQFGWSRVTITRALNELVWEGTLKRIQGSGTYVDSPVDSPASGPRKSLRIMVSAHPFPDHSDYCSLLFAGIRDEAATQNVDIVYHNRSAVPTAETTEKLGVHAVLAISWQIDDLSDVRSLHREGVPVVGLALRSRMEALPLVCTDNFGGVSQAVGHLLEAGHRRIAYTTINIQNSDVLERVSAFHHRMAQAGLTVDPACLLISSRHMDVAVLEAWWKSLNPPATAFLLDGTVAGPMLSLLQRRGVRIPEDLSLIVIDEVQPARHFHPALTVLRQPTYELGRRGLAKLIEMLRGEDHGAPEVLPTELILRDSVAPAIDSLHFAPAPALLGELAKALAANP